MSRKDAPPVTNILRDFVAVDTRNPPGNELTLISNAARILKSFGIESEVIDLGDNRGNLIASVKATTPVRDPLILSGHLDTVNLSGAWETVPFELTETDGVLVGLGAADMKGALACQLAVLLEYSQRPEDLRQDLWIVWTAGEEVDCIGARHVTPQLQGKRWTGIVIGEPSLNQVTTAQKGALWVQLVVTGVAAHGAYPERGSNAIRYSVNIVDRVIETIDGTHQHPLLGPITVNWSMFKAGSQVNIVPDSAETFLDIRFPPPVTKEQIVDFIHDAIDLDRTSGKNRGATAEVFVSVKNHRDAFETPSESSLVTEALSIAGQTTPVGMRAYTDGSVFAHELSCPVIILGPGDIAQAHAPNESVAIEQLHSAVRIYTRLAGR